MRLIDAEHLKRELNCIDGFAGCADISENTRIGLNMMVDLEPTVDAAQVVHAHWKLDPDGMDWGIPAWTCSHCGGRNDMIPPFITTNKGGYVPKNPNVFAGSNYCPCCGAKMDEEGKL